MTSTFGTIEVVEGHVVLVPEGVPTVAVIFVEGVSTHQPEVENPVVVADGDLRVIYG